MGGKNSTQSRRSTLRLNKGCPICAWRNVELKDGSLACLRCGAEQGRGTSATVTATSSVMNSSSSTVSTAASSSNSLVEPLAPEEEEEEEKGVTLTRIHVCPFSETLPEETANSCMYEETIKEVYLDEFFSTGHCYLDIGSRFQVKEVDFLVTGAIPLGAGWVKNTTEVRCLDRPVSALSRIQKLHVLPTLASWETDKKYDPQVLFNEVVRPYFNDEKHVAVGDTFLSNGVQCKIIAGEPENGVVDEHTQIYCNGEPIPDLTKLHMLPIYESLPNRDKDITSQQLFEKYLEPYFTGRFRYIVSETNRVCIQGVDFKIVGCEPDSGLVSLNTIIYTTGEPLREDDLRRYQEEQDAAMARQLQQQEARSVRMPLAPGALIQSDDLRSRLQAVLRDLPEGDRNRAVVQSLHDQLVMLPYLSQNAMLPRNLSLLAGPAARAPPTGCSAHEIENLPTRIFSVTTSSSDKEHNTCRVCLSEYEESEVVRTLPCFHSYHKECIDNWLNKSKKCPICKHDVA